MRSEDTADEPADPVDEIRAGLVEVIELHESTFVGATYIPVESLWHLLERAESRRVRAVELHDSLDDYSRREGELYALLLLEVVAQTKGLLRTPGKGDVTPPTGAGSPISRLGAAIEGLRVLRDHLRATDP